MNKILTDQAKSFKFLRPGNNKPILTYTRNMMNTVFLPIVTNEQDIFTSVKNLCGPMGAVKSFYRYYFPKRLIYQSTLYIKPRTIEFIDDKYKKNLVKANLPGFRGIPRNKLYDMRNVILDYTDLLKMAIPTDHMIMTRAPVINYVENIIPEIICYILFKNNKHEEITDPEFNEESLKNEMTQHTLSEEDDSESREDMEFKEFNDKLWDKIKSDESFTEKLFSKTKLFSTGGPIIGLDQYGFTNFIISFKMNMKTTKYFTRSYLSGDLPIMRAIKVNPDLIYQISTFRFIYKLYEAYYYGKQSDNEFINEFLNKEIAFHIWSESGLGFVINFDELKNVMKYKPDRFLRKLSSALSILVFKNVGTLKDVDIDKFEEEENDTEFTKLTQNINPEDSKNINITNNLKANISNIVKNDYSMKAISSISKEKDTPKVEEIDSDNIDNIKTKVDEIEKTSSTITEKIPVNVNPSVDEIKEFMNVTNKFKANAVKNNVLNIKSTDPDTKDVSFSIQELDDVLNADETEDNDKEPNVDDEDQNQEIETVDDSNSEDSDILGENDSSVDINQVSDEINNDDSNEEPPDFAEKYGSFDDDVVDEEESDDNSYTVINPKKSTDKLITLKSSTEKQKILTPADQKRIDVLKNKYKSIDIGGDKIEKVIGNANNIAIEKFNEGKRDTLRSRDKNTSKLNLSDFQKSYTKNNYEADIINSVRSLSKDKEVPLYITKADIKDTSDQFSDKLTYSFQLKDEYKKTHTLTFDVPKLSEDGLMKINGNETYLKKQLIRKPIVKIGPDQVYITVQLNSFRVERKGSLINRSSEIMRRLINEYFVDNPGVSIERGNCLEDNKEYLTTLEYDALAKNYFIININPHAKYGSHIQVIFSQKRIRKLITELNINTGFKDNVIPNNILPIAIDLTKKVLYSIDISKNNSVNSTIISCINDTLHDKNMIDFIKNIRLPKRRIYSEVEIQSKKVPLITFLNYTFGWERVKSYFPENHITFEKGSKLNLSANQLYLKFHDGYMYYDQYPINGAMLINGLTYVNTENYNYEDLNNSMLYLNFLQDLKYQTKNIVKGWKTVKESMLDYKTLQILEEMGLPTDLLEIFLYCNDLLTDNQVRRESDISNYRIRGNEIISECLYKVLTDEYNTFKKRAGKKLTLSIPRNAVMSKVYKTEIMEYYNCLSPMAEIKNNSTTTFKGPGGTKLEQAFTKEKRAFDESYLGTFGMSTPDNHTTGIVKELTMNPKIINTLGFVEPQDKKNISLNDIATAEEALTPFVNKMDDPSRVAFVSIQNTHVGGLKDSSLPTVRTGTEKVIYMESGDNFCKKAKLDGIVTDIDEITKKVFIQYKDGTKDCLDYNNIMLKNSDAFNQNFYDCIVKVGQKVKEGDPIVVDGRFFKKDPITKELIYTQARNAMVAIMEGGYTEDDSDLITESLSSKLKMNFTKRKQISINPDDSLISYKNVGDTVSLGDPLIVFDESGTLSQTNEADENEFDELFSDIDNNSLSEMIHQTPKSPISGKILDIKVYWTVPTNKMSPSIAKFVNKYISNIKKDIIEEEKFTGKPSNKRCMIETTKMVNGLNKINGVEIDKKGGIVIEYFIGGDDIMSNGDKTALFSSLKSVNSIVVEKDLEPYAAESGDHVDAIYSFISCEARMINSVFLAGSLGKLIHDYSKNWARETLESMNITIPKTEYEK